MSGKNVRFGTDPTKGGSRSLHHDRDSGVGSSSSEQASTGGRPDRRFTAQDRESQRYSIPALQEALDVANQKVKGLQSKNSDLDRQVAEVHKANREVEARRRALFEENSLLKDNNHALKEQVSVLKEQVSAYKSDLDSFRDENADLHQRLLAYSRPIDPAAMMSGGSGGSPASISSSGGMAGVGVRRSMSKRESVREDREMQERLRERLNKNSPEPDLSSSSKGSSSKTQRGSVTGSSGSGSGRARRGSVSIGSRPSSSSNREPYIEEPQPAGPSSHHHSRTYSSGGPHYIATTGPPVSPIYGTVRTDSSLMIPRTVVSSAHTVPAPYGTGESGNYVAYPLPEDPKAKRRQHR